MKPLMSLTVVIALLLSSCSSTKWLPSQESTTDYPWKSFQDAKDSFDQIVVNVTEMDELQDFGYEVYTPNLERLNYLDIISKFIPTPAISLGDIDPNVKKCILQRENCFAFHVVVNVSKENREGNVLLDLLNFKKESRESGWSFDAFIVILNDTVIYKTWKGKANIVNDKSNKNPLGPLQGGLGKLT